MSALLSQDPVLPKFRHRLDEIYGDRLARAVLYGSRARGDAHGDSDYDVAIFLTTISNWDEEQRRLDDLRVEMFEKSRELFDMTPFLMAEWPDRTPLMGEIRREGIVF